MNYHKTITLKDGRTCVLRNGTGEDEQVLTQRASAPGRQGGRSLFLCGWNRNEQAAEQGLVESEMVGLRPITEDIKG